MLFSSITFLFVFLPVVLAVYFLVPYRFKNLVMLIASLFFYAWGEPVYVILMILSICLNYVCGLDIAEKSEDQKKKRNSLIFAVVFNLLILGFFKYYGFLMESVNAVFPFEIPYRELPLPIGISFYTFQALSYIIDVYRGEVKPQKKLLYFALYISMFPQLIAGPIVRYVDIEEQLEHRTMNLGSYSVLTAWIGCISYAFQIYFDFGGYSDMAIGLGKMFGFEFLENFHYPYVSTSVTEFWRRWHISLSTWFREYVYIPLGGNRKGDSRTICNLLIVWMLTGFWHGAAWNFLAWGLYYGIILVLEKFVWGQYVEKLPNAVKHIYAMVLVLIGWVLFFSPSLGYALKYIGVMFGIGASGLMDKLGWFYLLSNWLIYLMAVIGSTSVGYRMMRRIQRAPSGRAGKCIVTGVIYLAMFALSLAFLVTQSFNPFLYFRF